MKSLLGGKGANLHEMTRIGLPVPPGFTITTEVCTHFYAHNRTYPRELEAEVAAALAKVEKSVGKKFGDKERPLLVSVRSGARDSMPGMMDTILNLGMNDEVVEIVAKKTNNARFAWDSYRRFLQMYGDVVMGVQKRPGEDHEPFETVIEHLKDERYGKHDFPDVRLTVADLKELVQRFKALIKERTGKSVSTRSAGAALGRNRGGFRIVDERSRDRLPSEIRNPARMGNGRERADDGVWEHGRNERNRGRIHARSGDRRKSLLWRIFDQRPGRRRRRRRAHASSNCRFGEGNARSSQRADESPRDP